MIRHPIHQNVLAFRLWEDNFFINLLWNLDTPKSAHFSYPFPEFGDPLDRIVVAIGIDEHIGVEEIEYMSSPVSSAPASSRG